MVKIITIIIEFNRKTSNKTLNLGYIINYMFINTKYKFIFYRKF